MAITKIIQNKDPITIIIPTAGMGRRMKKGPRALLDIEGEKLISRQIRILKKIFPFSEIIVVLGYGADSIYEFIPPFVHCIENEFYESTNVSRSIALGLRASTTQKILIVYGDLVFSRTTFFLPDHSSLFLDKNGKNDSAGVNMEKQKIAHLSYASKIKWGHSIYLQGPEIDIFKKVCYNRENKKHYGHEIINMSIDLGAQFQGIYCAGPLMELDTLSDLLRLKLSEEKI
jgi:choline kinase